MGETLRAARTEQSPGEARIGRPAAGLIGLLAVAAALGAGHLVAGLLLDASASPYLAVGNASIDRTPAAVKDFAIDQFGSSDKLALLLGMGVVLALLGIGAGLLSRARALPGQLVLVALGAVATLAVLEQAGGAVAVLAPLAALGTGLWAFWRLHELALARVGGTTGRARNWERRMSAQRPSGLTVQRVRGALARRGFLTGTVTVAAGAAVTGFAGQLLANRANVEASRAAIGEIVPDEPAPPIPPGADFAEAGTPRFLTPLADFYRVDINLTVPQLTAENARLRITGMVERELEFGYADLLNRRLVERTITMTCVSNFVGGSYVSTANFVGVPLRELLTEAGVRPEATQLVGRSTDGFILGTPLRWALEPGSEALLALGMNRRPLLPEHGFPLRTVIAGLYGYVSATKWLTELELATFDVDPYWEVRGWDNDPGGIVPIKTQSRIDVPGSFERVTPGEVTFAGIAWAQTRGITRVEVQIDDGEFTPAELAAAVNPNTWRMWRARRRVTQPGVHSVTVRATDGTGAVQTPQEAGNINPGPDGATGWHTVSFRVG